MFNNTSNQPSKFRTRYLVENNDDVHETYNTNNRIIFKTPMLKSRLYDYGDTYSLKKSQQLSEKKQTKHQGKKKKKRDKEVIFKI